MRVGLFGGSFDPIHHGHIAPVQEARRRVGLDRVIYLPTARPPHKPERSFAPAYSRYAMVELALLHEPGLYASAHELVLDSPTYTVETVEQFRRERPHDELFLIVGADALGELHLWKRWRDLLAQVGLVVLARPDSQSGDSGDEVNVSGLARELLAVENRPVGVSSTELRAKLRSGEPPSAELVPTPVLDYIRKYELYR